LPHAAQFPQARGMGQIVNDALAHNSWAQLHPESAT